MAFPFTGTASVPAVLRTYDAKARNPRHRTFIMEAHRSATLALGWRPLHGIRQGVHSALDLRQYAGPELVFDLPFNEHELRSPALQLRTSRGRRSKMRRTASICHRTPLYAFASSQH